MGNSVITKHSSVHNKNYCNFLKCYRLCPWARVIRTYLCVIGLQVLTSFTFTKHDWYSDNLIKYKENNVCLFWLSLPKEVTTLQDKSCAFDTFVSHINEHQDQCGIENGKESIWLHCKSIFYMPLFTGKCWKLRKTYFRVCHRYKISFCAPPRTFLVPRKETCK